MQLFFAHQIRLKSSVCNMTFSLWFQLSPDHLEFMIQVARHFLLNALLGLTLALSLRLFIESGNTNGPDLNHTQIFLFFLFLKLYNLLEIIFIVFINQPYFFVVKCHLISVHFLNSFLPYR